MREIRRERERGKDSGGREDLGVRHGHPLPSGRGLRICGVYLETVITRKLKGFTKSSHFSNMPLYFSTISM